MGKPNISCKSCGTYTDYVSGRVGNVAHGYCSKCKKAYQAALEQVLEIKLLEDEDASWYVSGSVVEELKSNMRNEFRQELRSAIKKLMEEK